MPRSKRSASRGRVEGPTPRRREEPPAAPRREAPPERPALRTAVLGLGTIVMALGLVIGGFVLLTRGGGSGGTTCDPDAQGWNGAGGGGDHRGARDGVPVDHGAAWAPAWQTPATPAAGDRLTAPAAVAGGLVLTGDASGRLVAFDQGSGRRLWDSPPGAAEAGPATLPVAVDGCTAVVVTVTSEAGTAGAMRAVDLNGHGRRFGVSSDDRIQSAPELLRGVAFVGLAARTSSGLEERTDGIDLLDGAHRFQQRFPAAVEASVAAAGDRLYAGDFAGTVYAFSIDSDGRTLHQLWSFSTGGIVAAGPVILDAAIVVAAGDGRVSALDPGDGHELWHGDAGGTVETLPVAAGGVVAVASRSGRITAFDAGSGAMRWTVETGSRVTGMAAAGGALYAGGDDGVLRSLDIAGAGRERSRWNAGAPLLGSPAVAAGRVVVVAGDGRVSALPL